MAVTFGSLSGDCGPAAPVSCHGIFAAPGGGRTSFALGQLFVLDVTSMLRGVGSFGEGAGPFGGGTTLGLRLFESDGITPVGIRVVPEPAAWMTGALGLAMLLTVRLRIRHSVAHRAHERLQPWPRKAFWGPLLDRDKQRLS
jgi:hypothetical protein